MNKDVAVYTESFALTQFSSNLPSGDVSLQDPISQSAFLIAVPFSGVGLQEKIAVARAKGIINLKRFIRLGIGFGQSNKCGSAIQTHGKNS